MTNALLFSRVNFRHELRLGLLAAAESCWIYALVLTISANMGLARQISPVGIFIVYWIALLTGRILPQSKQTWRALQLVTILIAVLALLVAVRIGLYSDTPLTDMTWLPNFVTRTLSIFERVTAEEVSTLVLIFTFLRGMGFAQRPLTLWLVGFQFRIGIVVFFLAAFVSAMTYPVDFIAWIFVYFALSLPGIALARIEEAGQERPLGGKWAFVMLTAVVATMLLGFFASQFLTLETLDALFRFLAPLGILLQIIATLVAVPLFFLLDLLGKILGPALDLLRDMLKNLSPGLVGGNPFVLEVLNRVTRTVVDLMPYLRLLGVIAILLFIGWLIARALNKRMQWEEKEMFAREALDKHDVFSPAPRKPRRAGGFARHEIHAENVRRIYAALLAQSENMGLPRREAETPLEFLPRLAARFPETTPALEQITHAYIAVHYAQQPATDIQVRELRTLWKTTQAQIQASGRKSQAARRN